MPCRKPVWSWGVQFTQIDRMWCLSNPFLCLLHESFFSFSTITGSHKFVGIFSFGQADPRSFVVSFNSSVYCSASSFQFSKRWTDPFRRQSKESKVANLGTEKTANGSGQPVVNDFRLAKSKANYSWGFWAMDVSTAIDKSLVGMEVEWFLVRLSH